MRTEIINEKWAEIFADEGKELARKADGKPVGTKARVLRENLGEWTETDPAEIEAAEEAARYKARVVALIRERYDADDETALLANRGDGDPEHAEEYAAWQAYREQCKQRARAEVAGEEVSANTPSDQITAAPTAPAEDSIPETSETPAVE